MDGSNWMATRRAKQQQEEEESKLKRQEEQAKQAEEKNMRRKSQLEALKVSQLVTILQADFLCRTLISSHFSIMNHCNKSAGISLFPHGKTT